MNSNQFVGGGILASIILAFFTSLVIAPIDPAQANGWYSFSGLGMIVFGIWAAIKLLKLKK